MCSITRASGLAEDDHVGQQSQRNENRCREEHLGELQHRDPPSTPLDSEGTARSRVQSVSHTEEK